MKISDIQKLKKEELVELCVKHNLGAKEEFNSSKRPELIKLLRNIIDASNLDNAIPEAEKISPDGFVVEQVSEESESNKSDKEAETTSITSLSAEWTDFILSKLDSKEKVDGYPSCDGLRRLFEVYIGTIISSDMVVMQCPDNTNGGRATVKSTITYIPHNQLAKYIISDVADCYFGNTIKPYCQHPTATAATMAEGRALRKALRLRTQVKEEMQSPKGDDAREVEQIEKDQSLITESQKNTLKRIAERVGIDLEKFISYEKVEAKTLDILNHEEAAILLQKINRYQQSVTQGGLLVPDEIKKT